MRALDDRLLLGTPLPELLREITGLEPEASGHVVLAGAGVRSTQRLAAGDVGGGVALLTWPAELQPQAKYLYSHDRARRLLKAAKDHDWLVEPRPHLAFWLSRPHERLYLEPTLSPEDYVAIWAGPAGAKIGQHETGTIATGLWPWLRERRLASGGEEALLEPFVARLKARNRAAHFRPGLRLLRRWSREAVAELSRRRELTSALRASVNALLAAVDDAQLPAR